MASVVIDIASEFTGKKAFKQAEGATDKLSKSVKNLAKTFGLTFGTAAVIGYAKASVKAAAADQKAQQQLALALKNVGLERDAASAERFIQTLQSEYGVIDDLLRPSYQKLAVATKNTAETQRLLGIALDISASTGKDLDSVTGALSKAYLGNNTALGKLGVGISKADLKTKSFKDITEDLGKTFKGSAKAASETFAGSIAKLGVAAANVQEIIGTGLIDALKMLSDDKSVSDLATNMENAATNVANLIRGMGVLLSQLDQLPGGFKLDVAMIPIIGTYLSLLTEAGAKAARIAAVGGQKNPIQSGSYLSTQKKITALTKEQQKAQAKILADKKLTAALDKANLALGKSTDIFDMDKIQLNAALIGQAEALGKATTGAQLLAIANDVARLKVKQDINELEAAIASKDVKRIEAATKQLNADLAILGTLQSQNFQVLSISSILAALKPADLINQSNLDEALRKIYEMMKLLAGMGAGGGGTSGGTSNKIMGTQVPEFKGLPKLDKLTGNESIGAILEYSAAVTELATVMAEMQEAQNAAASKALDESILGKIAAVVAAATIEANKERYGNAGGGPAITIIDKTSGLIEVVQTAVQENNRFGNNLNFAGAI